jgi:DNA repair protein RecN (Recombination protein N)
VEINQSRQVLAESLQKAITHELHDLKMPEAVFNCQITALKQADIELDFMFFDRNGMDEISFLLGHGADGSLKPIAKTASGGELSRIMLAMQVVLTENQPEITYIFDEVDAGIGGETAIEVGKRLARLATRQQVIVVTHLPQVAAFADHHFAITGNVTAGIKISDVQLLDQQARETEIARMLGGIKTSEAALQHARELLTLKE